MRRLMIVLCLVFAVPLVALAENEHPLAEVFGGYSYFRANPEGFNLNGWNASVTGNITSWFGIEGDLSGHYGKPKDEFGYILSGIDIDQHTFMGGPRVAYRKGALVPFAHFLIGGARAGTRTRTRSRSDFALATVVGGGLDIRLSKTVAIRAIQADYLMTRFDTNSIDDDERQNNFRLSAGIVFMIGER